MKTAKIFSAFTLGVLFVLVFSNCGSNAGGDKSGPGIVTMTQAVVSSAGVTLSWTDPADSDLSSVVVSWKETSMADAITSEVAAGTLSCAISGWTAGYEYTVTLRAKDDEDNLASAVSFKVTPAATAKTYYFIYTAAELNAVRGGVTGYTDWGLDDGYVLMADIDLASAAWTPIGANTVSSDRFTGTFEGNGHVISGLSVTGSTSYQGLFGFINSTGIVRDLGVSGTVSGAGYVGGLVGFSSGTISNCYAAVSTEGTAAYVGGLVGCNNGNMTKCYSTGNVTSTSTQSGGLVGGNNGPLSDSYSTGNVSGTGDSVGGLAGYNTKAIDKCYSTGSVTGGGRYTGGLVGNNSTASGTISKCYSTGSVTGTQDVGGLLGYNSSGSISISYASGNVTGTNVNVGGLVGNNGGPISNCYSVSNKVTSSGNSVGGLVGSNSGAISYSYSVSYVEWQTGVTLWGGFIGNDYTATYTACYFDSARAGRSYDSGNTSDLTGVTGLATSAMLVQTTYSGWDFAGETANGSADIWTMGSINQGYPYLTAIPPSE